MRERDEEIREFLEEQTEMDVFGPEMCKVLDRTTIDYNDWEPMSHGTKIGGYPT